MTLRSSNFRQRHWLEAIKACGLAPGAPVLSRAGSIHVEHGVAVDTRTTTLYSRPRKLSILQLTTIPVSAMANWYHSSNPSPAVFAGYMSPLATFAS